MKQLLFFALVLFSSLYHKCYSQSLPSQPLSGPGGSNYTHGGVTQFRYADNGNGEDFWLYEPNSPTPDSANVVVFIHGLGMVNPKYYGAFITHLVRKGNIVIAPRYQKDLNLATGISEYNDSCAKGIQKALDTIQQPGHVKGRVQNYFVLGHSVGGVLTANMTMLYAQYGLPKPRASFSMQPGASNYLMSDYSSFPADVKYLILIGENDAIVGTGPGTTIYNQTVNVSTSHKNLIHHFADNHGNPGIGATHDEPGAGNNDFNNGESNLFITFAPATAPDAFDYYCTWKLQDALMDCALNNQNCEYAFGDTPEQHGMGNWSDGTPVRILEVTPSAATSLSEPKDETAISVFPNPTRQNYQVRIMNHNLKKPVQLLVYDLTGKLMDNQILTTQSLKLETSNWNAGVYFYQLKDSASQILKCGKLVVE